LFDSLDQRLHHTSNDDATNENYIVKALLLIEMTENKDVIEHLLRAYKLVAIFSEKRGNLDAAET
jgi:hypothetical protein